VTERPILFSAPMVRAILLGKKTQTRRVVDLSGRRVSHRCATDCSGVLPEAVFPDRGFSASGWEYLHLPCKDGAAQRVRCPQGPPGECLWVRETFQLESNFNIDGPEVYPPPFSDGRPIKWEDTGDLAGRVWWQPHYRATDPDPELSCERDDCSNDGPHGHWSPSIYMPRWASRITLEVTAVRVQRLQEITEDDARAEGVPVRSYEDGRGVETSREGFRAFWDSINGKRAPWSSNPWVWAISFRRVI
jgi:hypothetical protein